MSAPVVSVLFSCVYYLSCIIEGRDRLDSVYNSGKIFFTYSPTYSSLMPLQMLGISFISVECLDFIVTGSHMGQEREIFMIFLLFLSYFACSSPTEGMRSVIILSPLFVSCVFKPTGDRYERNGY